MTATLKEYEDAKLEIIRGVEYKEHSNIEPDGRIAKQYITEKNGAFYEVTDAGVVKYRSNGKVCPNYGDGKDGYRKIKLYSDGGARKSFWVSRLVYQAFRGEIPAKMQIDHVDGNRVNNALENLMLVTCKQNCALKKQRDSNYLFNKKRPKGRKKA